MGLDWFGAQWGWSHGFAQWGWINGYKGPMGLKFSDGFTNGFVQWDWIDDHGFPSGCSV